jgi:hypothetical protein
LKDRRSLHSFQNRFGVSQWVSESVSKWKCKTNRETMRYGQFFIFSVLFADYSDYSNIEYSAEYCDYSEYSVSKPNIRPSIPIIHFLFFFLWKNMPIIAIIPNIRFLNRIYGQVFRLFIFYFFFYEKTCRLLRLFRIFGF